MFSKKIIGIVFVAIAAFTSCKKDSDTLDNTALLTTGKWKITAESVVGKSTFATKLACEKDDFFFFTTDGKAIIDQGATKCDPTEPQTRTATWAFTNTENTKLLLTQDGFPLNVDVLELTSTTLKWSIVNPITGETIVQTHGK